LEVRRISSAASRFNFNQQQKPRLRDLAAQTIMIRPFGGTGWLEYRGDLNSGKQKYFFGRDWTAQITLILLENLFSTRIG
jgi:hypothetical protein